MPSVMKFELRDPAAMLGFLERVCESKARYPSANVALRAKHGVMTKAGASVVKRFSGCHPYRCPFCGEFHLGHPRPGFAPGFEWLEAGR